MRDYIEIMDDVQRYQRNPRKLRKLHKELKQYGDGLPFMYRYPNCWVSIGVAALIIGILTMVVVSIGMYLLLWTVG